MNLRLEDVEPEQRRRRFPVLVKQGVLNIRVPVKISVKKAMLLTHNRWVSGDDLDHLVRRLRRFH